MSAANPKSKASAALKETISRWDQKQWCVHLGSMKQSYWGIPSSHSHLQVRQIREGLLPVSKWQAGGDVSIVPMTSLKTEMAQTKKSKWE